MTTILEQYNRLSANTQYCISEYFMQQLKDYGTTNPCFFVKAEAFQARLFEFVLTVPTVVTQPDGYQAVQVKGQLNHIVQPQGEGADFKLLNLPKGKGRREGAFNKGHYSNTLCFGKELVDAKLLQQGDIDNLINYAAIWSANGDSNYVSGSPAAKQRCWLTSRGNQGYMTFELSERQDADGNMVPALENVCWTANTFHIIGTGVQEVAAIVNQAPALAMSPDVTTAPAVNQPVGRVIA